MKYIKKFKNSSDYSTYRGGESWLTPNLSFIEAEAGIRCTPKIIPIKRIATFEVTDRTSNILFNNCKGIKSIKVNGVVDESYVPYTGDIEVITNNVDIFNSLEINDDLFIQDENGDYNLNFNIFENNIQALNIIDKLSLLKVPKTLTFEEGVNTDNLCFCLISSAIGAGMISFNDLPIYDINDDTLTLNENFIEVETIIDTIDLLFLYDKTNPYKKYTFTATIPNGTKEYKVFDYGRYEVEIELSKTDLPLDMFSDDIISKGVSKEYRIISPLISVNNDFLKGCVMPSFANTNITNITIPSSAKLPIPMQEKYYNTDFRNLGTYWQNCVLGLFSCCIHLENINFEEGTIVSVERLLGFIQDCDNLTNIDFKNVIWNHDDNEFYEKVKYFGFDKTSASLGDILFLTNDYYSDNQIANNIKYINLNGMINSDYNYYFNFNVFQNLEEINFGECDFSNISDMSHMFSNNPHLQKITMLGPINKNAYVDYMFSKVAETGDFYYDTKYDYSKIINVLPSGWNIHPYIGEDVDVLNLSITGSNIAAVEIKAPITFTATISYNENGTKITKEVSGRTYSNNFETNPSDNPREIEIEFTLNNKKATTTVIQGGLENFILTTCEKVSNWTSNFNSKNNLKNKIDKVYINNVEYTLDEVLYSDNIKAGDYFNMAFTVKDDALLDYLFYNFSGLISADLSHYKRDVGTRLDYLFFNCTKVESINLDNLNVSRTRFLECMFNNCTNLKTVSFKNWNIPIDAQMDSMFYHCTSITEVNLSDLDMSNVYLIRHIFDGCTNLKTVYMKGNPNNVYACGNMFINITTTGKFYYDSRYDYSNFISTLPSTWEAIPYEY